MSCRKSWNKKEIRNVVVLLDAVGLCSAEICHQISEVYGFHVLSDKQVSHILAVNQQNIVAAANATVESSDVPFPDDDIEITEFLELFNDIIINYPVQTSKFKNLCDINRKNCKDEKVAVEDQRSQLNHNGKGQYVTECLSNLHPLHLKEPSNILNLDEKKDKMLYRAVHDILETLSPQNFSVSVSQIKQLGITTEESLNVVIYLVFEEAIDKPNFSIPYANMCKTLALLKVPSSIKEGNYVDIRTLLLIKCQEEFEKNQHNEEDKKERFRRIEECGTDEKRKRLQKTFEKKEKKNRKRQLGTSRFMCWLFRLNILMETMVHQCIKKLLLQGNEVAIECICLLLTAIGKELENDKSDTTVMDMYFSTLKKIVDKQQASSKIRLLLEDVTNLKMNKWVPCGNNNNPETIIAEILKEDKIETHEQEKMPLQITNSNRNFIADHQSLLNPEGIKQCDRELLLKLQFHPLSIVKPPNLPNLDRMKKKEIATANPQIQQTLIPEAVTVDSPVAAAAVQESELPNSKNGKVQKNDSSEIRDRLQDSPTLSGEGKDIKESSVVETPENKITLKYRYKKDQWSPSNPEGKKKYDREFLFNLRSHPLSMKKPSNLPKLDVIKDKAALFKVNKVNNRIASTSQYSQRQRVCYTDPSAFARTNTLGCPNNWVPQRDQNNPKTIDQIRKETEREAHVIFPKRIPDERDRRKNRPPMSEDGRNMSGKSSKGNYKGVDPMKLKLTKFVKVESMQLGSEGKFSRWGKGSSDGTESSGVDEDCRPAALQNWYISSDI